MAQNIVISPEKVFEFVTANPNCGVSQEDLSTPEGYQAAYDLVYASMTGTSPDTGESKRKAKSQTVLLLNVSEGTFENLGTHLGSVGKVASDPRQWSALHRVSNAAKMRVRAMAAKGILAAVVILDPEDNPLPQGPVAAKVETASE